MLFLVDYFWFVWHWAPPPPPPSSAQESRHLLIIKYQAMPSLRDVAHDGVLCTFINRSAPTRACDVVTSGQAAWTVNHVQNQTCWVTLLQPPRRAAV
jgi:hypothetical protein